MKWFFGGPGRDRTDDLFHAIAKYRRHSTYEPAQPVETAQWALFAGKMRAKLKPSGQRADRVESAQHHLGTSFRGNLR